MRSQLLLFHYFVRESHETWVFLDLISKAVICPHLFPIRLSLRYPDILSICFFQPAIPIEILIILESEDSIYSSYIEILAKSIVKAKASSR